MKGLALYIGYDPRLRRQYEVCRASAMRHAPNIAIHPLKLDVLDRAGILRRWYYKDAHGQMYDQIDGLPVSTEFTYSRFAVPILGELMGYEWALFCDSDFLWRASPEKILDEAKGTSGLWCVHHDYDPPEQVKMDGVIQETYPRKNWSSLMLFKVGDRRLRPLTHFVVGTRPGRWLHSMQWLDGYPGEIAPEWNWLVGWSDEPDPKAVHYTLGTPDMQGHENDPYSSEWWRIAGEVDTDGDV